MHSGGGSRTRIVLVFVTGCLIVVLPAVFELPTAAFGGPSSPVVLGSGFLCSASERVDDDPSRETKYYPSIAVDANGGAYAVWLDRRSGFGEVYFSYRSPGGPWSTNMRLSEESAHANGAPDISVDPQGNAYVVWADYRNGDTDVYSSYRPAGGSWGSNVRVNDDTGDATQHSPAVAVDWSGNAYAVWADKREGRWDIYFSYRPAGGSWGANAKVTDDEWSRIQSAPSIAVDPRGNAYAVWYDRRNAEDEDIYFSYRPADGSWGANVRVNDDVQYAAQGSPSIAVDAVGNAYASWSDNRDGGDFGCIYSSRRPVGGSWGPNARVDDYSGECEMGWASTAVGRRGPAYVVWRDTRNTMKGDIYLSYAGAKGPWAANVKVNDNPSEAYVWEPSVAVSHRGDAYIVWADERNSNQYDIFFALCVPRRFYFPLAGR